MIASIRIPRTLAGGDEPRLRRSCGAAAGLAAGGSSNLPRSAVARWPAAVRSLRLRGCCGRRRVERAAAFVSPPAHVRASASDAGSVVNLQELEDRVAQVAANLPELLSVVSMSWDPDVGLNIANVRGTAQTKGAICTAAFRSAADCAISQVGEMFDDVVLRSDNSTISSTIDPSKITAAFKA